VKRKVGKEGEIEREKDAQTDFGGAAFARFLAQNRQLFQTRSVPNWEHGIWSVAYSHRS
jgi:hypothetical protein